MSLLSKLTSQNRAWPWPNQNQVGILLLGIWLIATGAMTLFHVTFPASHTVMPVLAIAAGLILVLDINTGTLLVCTMLILCLAVIAHFIH